MATNWERKRAQTVSTTPHGSDGSRDDLSFSSSAASSGTQKQAHARKKSSVTSGSQGTTPRASRTSIRSAPSGSGETPRKRRQRGKQPYVENVTCRTSRVDSRSELIDKDDDNDDDEDDQVEMVTNAEFGRLYLPRRSRSHEALDEDIMVRTMAALYMSIFCSASGYGVERARKSLYQGRMEMEEYALLGRFTQQRPLSYGAVFSGYLLRREEDVKTKTGLTGNNHHHIVRSQQSTGGSDQTNKQSPQATKTTNNGDGEGGDDTDGSGNAVGVHSSDSMWGIWVRRWVVLSGCMLLIFRQPSGDAKDLLAVYQLFGPGWRAAVPCQQERIRRSPKKKKASKRLRRCEYDGFSFLFSAGKDLLRSSSSNKDESSTVDNEGSNDGDNNSNNSHNVPKEKKLSKSYSAPTPGSDSAEAGAQLAAAAAAARKEAPENKVSDASPSKTNNNQDGTESKHRIGLEALRLSEPTYEIFCSCDRENMSEWIEAINAQTYFCRTMPSCAYQWTQKDIWKSLMGAPVPCSLISQSLRPADDSEFVELCYDVDKICGRVTFPMQNLTALDGYQLENSIGSGNYGSVTRAVSTNGDSVAVKSIPKVVSKMIGKAKPAKEQERQDYLIRNEIECLELLTTSVSSPSSVGIVTLHAPDVRQVSFANVDVKPADTNGTLSSPINPELTCGIRENDDEVFIIMCDIDGCSLMHLLETPSPLRSFNRISRCGEYGLTAHQSARFGEDDSTPSCSSRSVQDRSFKKTRSSSGSHRHLETQLSVNSFGLPEDMTSSFIIRDRMNTMQGRKSPSSLSRFDLNPPTVEMGLPEGWARKVIRTIAKALLVMHHRGITHRDVKMENIQLSSSGEVYLLDFGFAAVSDKGINCSKYLIKNKHKLCGRQCRDMFQEFGILEKDDNNVERCCVKNKPSDSTQGPETKTEWIKGVKKKVFKWFRRKDAGSLTCGDLGKVTNTISGAAAAHNTRRMFLKSELGSSMRDIDLSNSPNLLDTWLGTKYTMAPEIWKKEKYNSTVDAWSLGVVAFYALFGTAPFSEFGGRAEYKDRILTGNFSKPTSWLSASEQVRSLISALLEPDPNKRATIHDILHDDWMEIPLQEPGDKDEYGEDVGDQQQVRMMQDFPLIRQNAESPTSEVSTTDGGDGNDILGISDVDMTALDNDQFKANPKAYTTSAGNNPVCSAGTTTDSSGSDAHQRASSSSTHDAALSADGSEVLNNGMYNDGGAYLSGGTATTEKESGLKFTRLDSKEHASDTNASLALDENLNTAADTKFRTVVIKADGKDIEDRTSTRSDNQHAHTNSGDACSSHDPAVTEADRTNVQEKRIHLGDGREELVVGSDDKSPKKPEDTARTESVSSSDSSETSVWDDDSNETPPLTETASVPVASTHDSFAGTGTSTLSIQTNCTTNGEASDGGSTISEMDGNNRDKSQPDSSPLFVNTKAPSPDLHAFNCSPQTSSSRKYSNRESTSSETSVW